MDRSTEFGANLRAIRDLLQSRHLGCLLLSDHSNVAWLSGGGRAYVSWSTDQGAARVLVTPSDVVLITSNNEAPRVEAEEFNGLPWRVVAHPWWTGPAELVQSLASANGPVAVDSRVPWIPDAVILGPEIAALRVHLSAIAQSRARALGKVVGRVMAEVCHQLKQGETEYEIAGRLVGSMVANGLDVPTCLIAADERAFQWRHFLPTDRRLDRYVILSACARKGGLVLSCTRLVHFGTLSDEIARGVAAVCRVEAKLIEATKPGATSGQLFEVARRAYTDVGFPEEWRHHHQGGLAGYRGREWFAAPEGKDALVAGQLVAWNPTVPGAKSEDTLLVTTEGNDIITASEGFPSIEIAGAARTIRRPVVLIR